MLFKNGDNGRVVNDFSGLNPYSNGICSLRYSSYDIQIDETES